MTPFSVLPSRQTAKPRKHSSVQSILEEKKRIEEAIAYIDWKQGFYDDVLSGKVKYFSNLLPRE